MKMNFSKFKKIRTEKDHTILQHPDGHEIRLLHNHLSDKIKKQLHEIPHHEENPKLEQSHVKDPAPKMMAEGGQAIKKEHYGENLESVAKSDKPRAGDQPDAQKKFAAAFADGGQASKLDAEKGKKISDSFKSAFSKGGGVHLHFYDGGATPMQEQSPADQFVAGLDQNQAPMQAPMPMQDTAQPMAQQPSPEAPVTPPTQSPMAPPTGSLTEQAVANTEAQNRAEMGAAKNLANASQQQADIYGNEANQMQELHNKYEKIGNDLHHKFEVTADEVSKGSVDPNHWFTSQNTLGQILTTVGMMFSGATLGAAGHPQMVGQTIDNIINRDIEAQKTNLQNKHTLLGKYMDMYQSLPQAEAAARLTMEAGVEGLIKQQASKLGSQNAMLQAQQTIADRRMKLLPQMEGLAKGQMMMGMYGDMNKPQQSGNGESAYQAQMQKMRILNPDLGKDMENKYLPGVGVSRVPVPEKVRDTLIASKDVQEKLAKLENFARQHQGTVMDRAIVNEGRTLAAEASSAVRQAQGQGVFKESDQHFLEGMVDPDPTKFLANVRTIPKYNALRKSIEGTVKQYEKGYGIKPFEQSQSSAPTATNAQGQQLTLQNGKWVPVK